MTAADSPAEQPTRKPSASECRYTEYPKCPYCGHEDQDWWDCQGEWFDGQERDVCCPDCGRDHLAIINYEITFQTYEKPHDD